MTSLLYLTEKKLITNLKNYNVLLYPGLATTIFANIRRNSYTNQTLAFRLSQCRPQQFLLPQITERKESCNNKESIFVLAKAQTFASFINENYEKRRMHVIPPVSVLL